MLRFTSQTFSFLFKKSRKVSFLSQRAGSVFQNKYFFTSAKIKAEFSEKLLSGKYYEVLGFTKETDINALSDIQVKRQYLAMVKKYHSDGVLDPAQKLHNQQITKCIISAFDVISSERIRNQISRGIYDKIYKDEDQISMKVYGKKFDQIKYELFKEGNSVKRAEFIDHLQRIKKESKHYDATNTTSNSSPFSKEQRQKPIHIKMPANQFFSLKYLIPLGTVLFVVMYYLQNQNEQKQKSDKIEKSKTKMTLGDQKIRQIQNKTTQLYQKKLTDLIDSFVEEQPPALKFPTKQDPGQMEQLLEYTIATDINLYEVSSNLMSKQQNLERLKHIKTQQQLKKSFGQEYEPFELSKIKVNSYISLSLEAERCLQNIYIKVKDVAEQIEQTGKYTPPKVFFRFYGYLMFDIRQKPLSLQNYRDTEYISLFDLFFDYYSPIPLKRHEYNEYLVGFHDQDMKMFGQVHLNHRKLSQKYISKNDKIVVMKDQVTMEQLKYTQIWHNFYQKYMRIWKRGYADRISTQHQ